MRGLGRAASHVVAEVAAPSKTFCGLAVDDAHVRVGSIVQRPGLKWPAPRRKRYRAAYHDGRRTAFEQAANITEEAKS